MSDDEFYRSLRHTDDPCEACVISAQRDQEQKRLHELRLNLLDCDNSGGTVATPSGLRRLTSAEKRALYHATDHDSLKEAIDPIFLEALDQVNK